MAGNICIQKRHLSSSYNRHPVPMWSLDLYRFKGRWWSGKGSYWRPCSSEIPGLLAQSEHVESNLNICVGVKSNSCVSVNDILKGFQKNVEKSWLTRSTHAGKLDVSTVCLRQYLDIPRPPNDASDNSRPTTTKSSVTRPDFKTTVYISARQSCTMSWYKDHSCSDVLEQKSNS